MALSSIIGLWGFAADKQGKDMGDTRKNLHKLSDDEIMFYKELSTALYNVRTGNGVPLIQMAKRCGYSENHMRTYENLGLGREKVSPIPSYIMAVYAETCGVKIDELCESWLSKEKKETEKEKHSKRIKYLSVGENDLLQTLRAFKKIGDSRISDLLGSLTKQDLELIYCLKQLEYKAENGEYIGNSIRHMVYQLYVDTECDVYGCDNITEI